MLVNWEITKHCRKGGRVIKVREDVTGMIFEKSTSNAFLRWLGIHVLARWRVILEHIFVKTQW